MIVFVNVGGTDLTVDEFKALGGLEISGNSFDNVTGFYFAPDSAGASGTLNVEGVYDDRKTLITEIKPFDIENLVKLKIVQGGMIPKIKNCIDAVENGVRGVVILDGRKPHSILDEIFSDKGSGTLIRK